MDVMELLLEGRKARAAYLSQPGTVLRAGAGLGESCCMRGDDAAESACPLVSLAPAVPLTCLPLTADAPAPAVDGTVAAA